jgi:hypothetical protein
MAGTKRPRRRRDFVAAGRDRVRSRPGFTLHRSEGTMGRKRQRRLYDAGTMITGRVRAHPGGIISVTQAAPASGENLPTSTPPRSWLTFGAPLMRSLYNAPPQAVAHREAGPKEPGQVVVVGTPGLAPQRGSASACLRHCRRRGCWAACSTVSKRAMRLLHCRRGNHGGHRPARRAAACAPHCRRAAAHGAARRLSGRSSAELTRDL